MNFCRAWLKGSVSNWAGHLQGRKAAQKKGAGRFWSLIAGGGALALTVLFVVAARGGHEIAREHGPMENTQTAFLLGALFSLGWQAWRERAAEVKMMRAGMGWGFLIFLMLEFDVRPFEVKWLNVLLNGAVRNTVLVLGTVALGAWVARHMRTAWAGFVGWLSTASPTLLVFAGALWFAGAIIERWGTLPKGTTMFVEELLETSATWLMMVATFVRPRAKGPDNGE